MNGLRLIQQKDRQSAHAGRPGGLEFNVAVNDPDGNVIEFYKTPR